MTQGASITVIASGLIIRNRHCEKRRDEALLREGTEGLFRFARNDSLFSRMD